MHFGNVCSDPLYVSLERCYCIYDNKNLNTQQYPENVYHARIQCVCGQGGWCPDPCAMLENIKATSFLLILWKITKLHSQHSMLCYRRPACEMAFRWRADDGPVFVAFWVFLGLPVRARIEKQMRPFPTLEKK